MLKTMKNILAAFVLLLISISGAFGQQAAADVTQKSESDFVTEKGFKSKVFEVKYRDADSLAMVVRHLGSGFKGASISASSEFKTITVRDFPENLATMEEALKRLDTPAAPRPNIELHMYMLIASDTSAYVAGPNAQIPSELKDVVTQLRETLRYRNYELATSIVQRLAESTRGFHGSGTAEVSGVDSTAVTMPLPYQYLINTVSVVLNATGAPTVQIREFAFTAQTEKERAEVQTALNLRDGEKVVVGTATIRNRALVIVLIAKLVN